MADTKQFSTGKKIAAMAMLTALAFAADFFLRIPNIAGFLTYEPKDVVLTIGAFIFGPVAGLVMALLVCLLEMVTASSTGVIGLLMNFLASATFVGVASVIYYRKKTMLRAVIGLIAGSLSMIAVMLLWNYIMTPIYMGVPRQAVLEMFLPVLVPFNAIKAGLNSALVLLLYKAVVTALRKAKLIPTRESNDSSNKTTNTIIVIVVSAVAVATMLLVMLIFAGII
jgi:riboflavin transporter FmnP